MDNIQTVEQEQQALEQQGKTFTQDDVNRIVKERLAKEKGKGNEELQTRERELDKRERRLDAMSKLRDHNLPDYLVDALNIETDEAFETSLEAVMKMKTESKTEEPYPIGCYSPIGSVSGTFKHDNVRDAFGLK